MDEDAVKPWTIKGIVPEDRNAAIAAAGREHVPIGVWLARAIRTQIQTDLNRERGVAVVTQQTSALAAPALLGQTAKHLDALVDVAVKVNAAELSGPIRRLVETTLVDEIRRLRRERKHGLKHERNTREPPRDPNINREGGEAPIRQGQGGAASGDGGLLQPANRCQRYRARRRQKGV